MTSLRWLRWHFTDALGSGRVRALYVVAAAGIVASESQAGLQIRKHAVTLGCWDAASQAWAVAPQWSLAPGMQIGMQLAAAFAFPSLIQGGAGNSSQLHPKGVSSAFFYPARLHA